MPLKNDILTLMETQRGRLFSGTVLAERFGVSRNAVWKAVNALKDEGHLITAVGKKGYMLSEENDRLSAEAVRAALGAGFDDVKILICNEVDSTNDAAKRLLTEENVSRAAIIADSQLCGRGRFGREFYSPAGTGLYLSVVLRPDKSFREAVMYTAAAAVAAARAIERTTGVSTQIKWINDLYLGGRKVCGILTEADTDFETGRVRSMVIGIGINVTTVSFPEEMADKAASIGRNVPRCRLAAEIIGGLYRIIDNEFDFLDEYRERCFLYGREIGFSDGSRSFRGTVAGIGDGCELILDTDLGRFSFAHGEITDF
ncbi:MAG: biotin--[acetyl-CoA-carboxylase] ligase [Ruminococcus sp.]|nr:biotin--[acetyl-CoA-carboxylase] ligase [Ruminococcus sp.]